METQVETLRQCLFNCCKESRDKKSQLRMLLDVEDLQSYLSHAFNHFSGDLERPFDFVEASLANSPILSNFGGNILKFVLCVMGAFQDSLLPGNVFETLSPVVASCIALDTARQGIPGKSAGSILLEHLSNH